MCEVGFFSPSTPICRLRVSFFIKIATFSYQINTKAKVVDVFNCPIVNEDYTFNTLVILKFFFFKKKQGFEALWWLGSCLIRVRFVVSAANTIPCIRAHSLIALQKFFFGA